MTEKKNSEKKNKPADKTTKPVAAAVKPSADVAVKPKFDDVKQRPIEDEKLAAQAEDSKRLNEIATGYRLMLDTPFGDIRIYSSSLMWVTIVGDTAYSKERFKLLQLTGDDKIPTLSEIGPLLKERGQWAESQDENIEQIAQDVEDANNKIDKGIKKETERTAVIKQRDDAIDKFWDLMAMRESIYGDTIETKSEIARRAAMIAKAVKKHQDGVDDPNKLEPVWDGVTQLLSQQRQKFYWILKQCQLFWKSQEIGESFLDETLETDSSK